MTSFQERFCPAKINLFLEVLGKREDGTHEIATIMVPLDVGDRLLVRKSRSLRLEVVPPHAAPVRGNTVLRAFEALRSRTKLRGGAHFVLRKKIPPGSGLGAGSSDAAAALLALHALYDLRVPPEILRLAAQDVGSDVPFFLQNGPALVTGRGERVLPLPARSALHFAILLPRLPLETRAVYGFLASRSLPRPPADVSAFLRIWTRPGVAALIPRLYNALEPAASALAPALPRLRSAVHALGMPCRMSGSGSSHFVLFPSRNEAERRARVLRRSLGIRTRAASSLA